MKSHISQCSRNETAVDDPVPDAQAQGNAISSTISANSMLILHNLQLLHWKLRLWSFGCKKTKDGWFYYKKTNVSAPKKLYLLAFFDPAIVSRLNLIKPIDVECHLNV